MPVGRLLGKEFEKAPRDHGEKKNDDKGGGVRTLPGGSFFLAPVADGPPDQGRAIFVVEPLSGSRNQYRFRQDLRFGSLCFGRQVGHLVVQLVYRPASSSFKGCFFPGDRRPLSADNFLRGCRGRY